MLWRATKLCRERDYEGLGQPLLGGLRMGEQEINAKGSGGTRVCLLGGAGGMRPSKYEIKHLQKPD